MPHKHTWRIVWFASPDSKSLSMVACVYPNCDEIGYLLDAEPADA